MHLHFILCDLCKTFIASILSPSLPTSNNLGYQFYIIIIMSINVVFLIAELIKCKQTSSKYPNLQLKIITGSYVLLEYLYTKKYYSVGGSLNLKHLSISIFSK